MTLLLLLSRQGFTLLRLPSLLSLLLGFTLLRLALMMGLLMLTQRRLSLLRLVLLPVLLVILLRGVRLLTPLSLILPGYAPLRLTLLARGRLRRIWRVRTRRIQVGGTIGPRYL